MVPKPHTTLVAVPALMAHVTDPAWVVVDCRSTLGAPAAGRQRYAAGHVPGAVHAHLEEDLSGAPDAHSGRHPLPDPVMLAQRLGDWGIDEGVQVVAYDDAGGVYAARLWWLLRWLGHRAVAVLDGGWQAWCAAGGARETAVAARAPRHFDPWPDDTAWLDTRELLALLATPAGHLLVDARAPERYRGEQESIDPVAGHIPGAINLPHAGNLDADGNFLSAAALRERYAPALDQRAPSALVCYCGSGVTACHDLLALAHAGHEGARLYAGSWSEWIRDPTRPVSRG